MKIELSLKEIELMLLLLYEMKDADAGFESEPVFSTEEISLIDKLENIVKRYQYLEKGLLDSKIGSRLH